MCYFAKITLDVIAPHPIEGLYNNKNIKFTPHDQNFEITNAKQQQIKDTLKNAIDALKNFSKIYKKNIINNSNYKKNSLILLLGTLAIFAILFYFALVYMRDSRSVTFILTLAVGALSAISVFCFSEIHKNKLVCERQTRQEFNQTLTQQIEIFPYIARHNDSPAGSGEPNNVLDLEQENKSASGQGVINYEYNSQPHIDPSATHLVDSSNLHDLAKNENLKSSVVDHSLNINEQLYDKKIIYLPFHFDAISF
jgi:hypothetical protein